MNLKMIEINFSKSKKINSIIQKLVREPKHNLVINIYFLKLFHIYNTLILYPYVWPAMESAPGGHTDMRHNEKNS
jgi:hypothetical protein